MTRTERDLNVFVCVLYCALYVAIDFDLMMW